MMKSHYEEGEKEKGAPGSECRRLVTVCIRCRVNDEPISKYSYIGGREPRKS